jgi:hypothetical protein
MEMEYKEKDEKLRCNRRKRERRKWKSKEEGEICKVRET